MNLVGTWMGMSFCFAAIGILIGNPIAGTIINLPRNEFTGEFIFAGSTVMVAAICFAAAKWGKAIEKLRHGRKHNLGIEADELGTK
jgi:hypothetical protein